MIGYLRTNRPTVKTPSLTEVIEAASLDGIALSEEEAKELHGAVVSLVRAAGEAQRFEQPRVEVELVPRTSGFIPTPDQNPYNAFIRRCDVTGAASGPLQGWRIGVKDNIAVAGVPMTNGSALPAFVPTSDAAVVERILSAGGSIVGTLNMDDFGGGATGVTSVFGPARNPLDPTRSAGGSSGGAGAAVASNAVDAALGVDQGGSGRIPAAFCGLVAAKATHGLVPSFGLTPIDHTIDHITPIAQTVDRVALLLEVIAGEDWRDPQWVRGSLTTEPYTQAKEQGVAGLRIGVVDEALSSPNCQQAVLDTMDKALAILEERGAKVKRFSAPWWPDGQAIFGPYVAHLVGNMMRTEGSIYGHLGYIDPDRVHTFAAGRRTQAQDLGPWVKCWIIASRYLYERYMSVPFARLHNARLAFRKRINDLFKEWDVLLTPTVPFTAPTLPEDEASVAELLSHSPAGVAFNTSPVNLTGHPALCVPGTKDADGLPASVQIIAGRFQEYSAFRVAFVLEEGFAG